MKDRRRMATALALLIGTATLGTGCSLFGDTKGTLATTGTSKLMVNSVEDGRVHVDGVAIGDTNEPLTGIEPGKHTITIIGTDGTEVFRQVALIPETGGLTLETNPELFTDDVDSTDNGSETDGGMVEETPDPTAIPDTTDGTGDSSTVTGSKALGQTALAVADGTRYETSMYIIDSGVTGPTVWIVGGVHGNEPAGFNAADTVKGYTVKKGRLIVLPRANRLAIAANSRYVSSTGDLNRAFPTSNTRLATGTLAKGIQAKLRQYKPDYLMDLHEGYDYYKAKTDSVGQTVIYYPRGSASTIASKIVNSLNPTIPGTYKDFSILKYPVPGSIARYAGDGLNVPSFIFETATKVDLRTRVGYQLKAVNVLLGHLGMR